LFRQRPFGRQHQQGPIPGCPPGTFELDARQHSERRAGRVVDDHSLAGPGDNDDVVIAAGPHLDEGDHGAPAVELFAHPFSARGRAGGEGQRPPPAPAEIRREHIRGDAGGAPIDQRREILGERLALAPVAHHHRHGRSAAQVLRLREVGHVEQPDAARRLGEQYRCARSGGDGRPQQQRGCRRGAGSSTRHDDEAPLLHQEDHDDQEQQGGRE
jgi:hypothetical protein